MKMLRGLVSWSSRTLAAKSRSNAPAPPARAILEEFEPRILYSADSPLALLGGLPTPSAVETRIAPAPAAEAAPHEFVFIDSRVADSARLVADLQAQRGAGRQLDIVVLDLQRDGIAQISEALVGQHDISAIHILSEGADGKVSLGAGVLDAQSVSRSAVLIRGWGNAMTADADLLIYGCDVAASAKGRALVESLATLTGADVAASTDLTGSTRLGADWNLEVHTGRIETAAAITAETQGIWDATLALFTVTNTNDSGAGSLRQAIINANAMAGLDLISFSIAGSGVQTITLVSALPVITDSVVIDGTTQTTNVGDTNPGTFGAGGRVGVDGVMLSTVERPEIEIRGDNSIGNGFEVQASNSVIRGLAIYGFGNSITDGNIYIGNAITGVLIEGNLLGTSASSFTDPGAGIRSGGAGIAAGGADNNTVRNNLIAYNGYAGIGLYASATGWLIENNQIHGNAINPFLDGIDFSGSVSGNTVRGNLITGSGGNGIDISVTFGFNTVVNNTVTGNGFGGAETFGIALRGSNNLVDRNIVSGNLGAGVAVNDGAGGNFITANSIFGNGAIGIDLQNSTDNSLAGTAPYVTANDSGDADAGGNGLQNFPVLASANSDANGTTIVGTLNSLPGSTMRIEFFATRPGVADSSGERYLGFATVSTDGAGNAAFNTTFANLWVNAGDRITATATDLGTNNTSEFAANVAATTSGIIVVDTTSDVADGATTSITDLGNARGVDGRISLREAIAAANNTANGVTPDKIVFDISGPLVGGAHTFALTSALPFLTDALIIDGSTEPDFASGVPVVNIDGTALLNVDGLRLEAGSDGSTIRGLSLTGFLSDGAPATHAISVYSDNNTVAGNYVGLRPDGSIGANWAGIAVANGGSNNLIGGAALSERNVVSGNGFGIAIVGGGAINNRVQGNYIGVAADGTTARPNTIVGIQIYAGADNNLIGGTAPGAGNLIANSVTGLRIGYPGLPVTGVSALGNTFYNNPSLAIDLDSDGVTPNDLGDLDSGPNDLQNFPVLAYAFVNGGLIQVAGTLNSSANTTYRIELFASPTGDASGYGEGKAYLGFLNITTDGAGDRSFTATIGANVPVGYAVSATATVDLGGGNFGSTSEFALNVAASANNAPVLDASRSPTFDAIAEDAPAPVGAVGTLVSALVDFTVPAGQVDNVFDADAGAQLGIAVIAADAANGTWWYSTDSGTSWNALGAVSDGSARLLAADAATRLYFQPNANYNGTIASAVTFRAWDQTSGSNGALGDTSVNGGATAFSSVTDTASLVVTAVNTAPTFGVGNGIVTANFTASTSNAGRGVVVQPDGKLVVAGRSYNGANHDFALARFNTDGTLDAGFGTGGQTTLDLYGTDDLATSVTLQLDGKILVAGYTSNGSNYDFSLVRYNANGSLDTTFNGTGKLTTAVGPGDDIAYSVVAMADGRILVAGYSSNGSDSDFSLVRYNANGSLDTTFAGTGIVTVNLAANYNDFIYEMAVQADGKIVVGGTSFGAGTNLYSLARLNTNGTLDTSFGSSGVVITDVGPFSDFGRALTLQADGKVLLAGQTNDGTKDNIGLVRYNTDGSLDASFNGTGIVTTSVGTQSDAAKSVKVQADGKILVSGSSQSAGNLDFFVVRYLSNGSIDTSFGNAGVVTTDILAGQDTPYSMTLQGDGRIVLTGSTVNGANSSVALTRYNPDGSLDTRFNLVGALNATPTFTEKGAPVVLDSEVQVFDAELTAADNFSGATLILARNGGVNAQDVFDATGTLGALTQGGSLVVGGTTIGTVTTNSGGTLVLTFNASATQARVNATLQQITYSNSSDAPSASAQINWSFSDGNSGAQGAGGALSATGSTTVTITAVNDVPVVATTGTLLAYTENQAATVIDVGVTVSDVDSANLSGAAVSISANFSTGQDVLAFVDQNGITGSWNAATGVLTLSGNSSVANYQTALRSVTYFNSSDTPATATRTVSFVVNDGAANSSAATRDIGVTAVNDAPVVAATGTLLAYTENQSATVIDSGITVNDIDNVSLSGATVSITANFSTGQDVLAFTDQLGITGSWNAGTGVLTLSGISSVANYQTALRSVTYINTSDAPNTATRTVSFVANDGTANSTAATRNIGVTAVNDAPVVTSNGGGANASVDVLENSSGVTTVVSVDPDGPAPIYSIAGGADAARFTINSSTGALSFVAAPNFEAPTDAGANNVYDVIVQASDGSLPASQAIAVTVTDQAITSATASGTGTVAAGGVYTLNLVANEDASSWKIVWGDGTIDTVVGNPSSVTHTYVAGYAGLNFNIMVSAYDASGAHFNNDLIVPGWGTPGAGLYRFAPVSGAFTQVFGANEVANPSQALLGPDGLLYVTGTDSNNVVRYNATTGALIDTFVASGSGGLSRVHSLAFGPDGNLYVGSSNTGEVLEFNGTTGAFIGVFVSAGSGGLTEMGVIAFRPDGYLYASNWHANNILRFDATTGAFVDAFVTAGSGGLDRPAGMDWGADGNLYVASYGTSEVKRFDGSTGAFIDTFVTAGSGGLFSSLGLVFGPNGSLYVASNSSSAIIEYDGTTGAVIRNYVAPGSGGMNGPMYIDFLPSAQVQVLGGVNQAPVLDPAKSPVLNAIAEDAPAPVGAVGTLVSALVDFATPAGQVDNVFDPDAGAQLGIAVTAADAANGTWWYSTDSGTSWNALGAVSDGSARLLAADAATRIYFQPNANYNGTLTGAITFRAWDRTSGSNSALADTSVNGGATAFSSVTDTASLVVTAVNDAPVVTTTGTVLAYTENQAAAAIDSGFTVNDGDNVNLSSATVSISANFAASQDLLSFVNQNGITGSFDSVTGVLTLSGSASLTNYQTALRSVTYFNTSNAPSTATRTVSFVANDGAANSIAATRDISVTAVNDAPLVATSFSLLAYTENQAAAVLDSSVFVIDPDNVNLSSITASISANFAAGQDVLGFVDQNGITGSWNAVTGVLTLSGTSSVANYQTALRSVTYFNTSDTPSTATRTVSFVANDGAVDSTVATRDVSVTAVNDAPVVATTGTLLGYTENQAATVIDAGVTVGDVDNVNLSSATVSISVNFAAGQDVLAFVDQNGITGSWNAATGVLTLSGSSSVANYQTALRSVTYFNTSDTPSTATRTVSFVVNDGTVDSNTATRNVGVTAVNDAPVVATTGTLLAYTENQAATVIDGAITVNDVDNVDLGSATVSISVNFAAGQDVLAFVDQNGITGSWNAGTGVLTLSGTSSVANYQTALRSVTYVNTSDAPSTATRTVSFVVDDGTAISVTSTRDIGVTAINDAPVVATSGTLLAYTENQAAIVIDAGVTVSDVDNVNLISATVSISFNFATGQDVLAFTDQLGITGSWNGGTGVLTLSGASSAANYQTALRSVTYVNTSDAPSTATRTVSFGANDGAANSVASTRDIGVTAVNDAPTVTNGASVTLTGTDRNTTSSGTSVNTIVVTAGWADVDAGAVNGMAITAASGNGTWQYSTDGLTWNGFGAVSSTNALLLASSTQVRYMPDLVNGETATFAFKAWDQTSGSASTNAIPSHASTASSGGTAALSMANATASLVVTAVNAAPVVTTTGTLLAYTENQTATLVDGSVTVSDVDNVNLSGATVRVSVNYATSQDVLAFNDQLGITGSWNAATGVLTLSGASSVANYQTALRSITYVNTSDAPSTAMRTVSFVVNDGTADSIAATRDIGVTAVNDAPVVATTGSLLVYTENQAATVVDGGVTVGDVDNANLIGAMVSISANFSTGQDVLAFVDQNGITGSWNTGTGVLTLTGASSVANYQTALRSVTYVNTSDAPSTATRTMSFVVNDGTANSVASTRDIGVTSVNDAPVGSPTINGTATENQMLTAVIGAIGDADGLGAFSYQWLRDGVAVSGATGGSYLLGNADVGARLSVQVSYVDGRGTLESLPSAPTAVTVNVNDTPVGVPAIVPDTTSAIQTLVAVTSGIADADGLGPFSYQWLRNGTPVGGATNDTYVLGSSDIGMQLSVQVSYTDAHGTAEMLTSASMFPVVGLRNLLLDTPPAVSFAPGGPTPAAVVIPPSAGEPPVTTIGGSPATIQTTDRAVGLVGAAEASDAEGQVEATPVRPIAKAGNRLASPSNDQSTASVDDPRTANTRALAFGDLAVIRSMNLTLDEAMRWSIDIDTPRDVGPLIGNELGLGTSLATDYSLRAAARSSGSFRLIEEPERSGPLDDERRFDIADHPGLAAGALLSTGMLWWATRAGGMVAALMASAPMWKSFDPLPILERRKNNADADAEAVPTDDPADASTRDEGDSSNAIPRIGAGTAASSAARTLLEELPAR